MSTKHLVIMIMTIVLTGFFCTSSSLTTKDKKPAKATSVVVKDDGKTKKDFGKEKNIYISENILYIKTPLINDLIYVYTVSGLCIDKFVKETELFVKDASAYPNGELIITNGKDLTTKVVK